VRQVRAALGCRAAGGGREVCGVGSGTHTVTFARSVGDLFAAVGIVFCIPFVILAIGIPIVLGVRFLLWIAGML
jgi:hypothetical protein